MLKNSNLEKMRGMSVAVDNYEMSKKVLDYCKSAIKGYTCLGIYGIICALIFGSIFISEISDIFYLHIVFVFLVLGAFYCGMSNTRRLKKEINNIQENGGMLLCYNSDVLEYYTTREADKKGRNYYLRLNNDVKLKVDIATFRDLKGRNVERVNVYYYEKLLELDRNAFQIEEIQEQT